MWMCLYKCMLRESLTQHIWIWFRKKCWQQCCCCFSSALHQLHSCISKRSENIDTVREFLRHTHVKNIHVCVLLSVRSIFSFFLLLCVCFFWLYLCSCAFWKDFILLSLTFFPHAQKHAITQISVDLCPTIVSPPLCVDAVFIFIVHMNEHIVRSSSSRNLFVVVVVCFSLSLLFPLFLLLFNRFISVM